ARPLAAGGVPGGPREPEVKDARREVHGPGEQAREEENRLVLRRVAPFAPPGVVLLAPRALAGHHVRVGAPLAGVVNRLVDVQHGCVLRRTSGRPTAAPAR